MTAVAQTTTSSFFAAGFEAVTAHIRTARARRARRVALVTLMDMDASQLDDLGLSVGDVMDALAARDGRILQSRRAADRNRAAR